MAGEISGNYLWFHVAVRDVGGIRIEPAVIVLDALMLAHGNVGRQGDNRVGHGVSLSGGDGQLEGTGGTGDPTIVYKPRPFMFSWKKYAYSMDDFYDEY